MRPRSRRAPPRVRDFRRTDAARPPPFSSGELARHRGRRRGGLRRFILASTGGAVLGDAVPPVHEGMPARPLSPYGASKLACEGYCSAYYGSYAIPTVALRFSNVYGPYSYLKGSVVPVFFKRILAGEPLVIHGDGAQTRDFLYVDDLCRAIVAAAERECSEI